MRVAGIAASRGVTKGSYWVGQSRAGAGGSDGKSKAPKASREEGGARQLHHGLWGNLLESVESAAYAPYRQVGSGL